NRGKKMGGFDLANLGGYGLGFGVGSVLFTAFASRLFDAFWVTSGMVVFTSILATKFLVQPFRRYELNQPGIRRQLVGSKILPGYFSCLQQSLPRFSAMSVIFPARRDVDRQMAYTVSY